MFIRLISFWLIIDIIVINNNSDIEIDVYIVNVFIGLYIDIFFEKNRRNKGIKVKGIDAISDIFNIGKYNDIIIIK